ncbi:hypothetical protein SLEP1_g20574 [Rubroshorea leprosula]|uniref:Uncharacterized protein n=1 Tax=Rubroshorea leprosula TaxID=152421 RepID=A0AAV5J349_9ROSI|nr:hypothetical protein SLEP1_g20574 [Rubroshorea leprosula]
MHLRNKILELPMMTRLVYSEIPPFVRIPKIRQHFSFLKTSIFRGMFKVALGGGGGGYCNRNNPVNLGVALGMDEWVEKLGLSCINMFLSDFYSIHGNYRTRSVLNIMDSKRDVVRATTVGKNFNYVINEVSSIFT